MNANNNLPNLLKLNSLDTQTTALMGKYKQSIGSYISGLNPSSKPRTKNDFSILPNSSFWGSSGITQTNNGTIDTCTKNCIADMTCTGSTFEPNGGICYLRKGGGSIQSSSPLHQTAVVLNSQIDTQSVSSLNSQILSLESQKSAILGEMNSQILDIKTQNSQYSTSIDSKLSKLNYRKNNIKHLYDKSNTLGDDYQNENLIATSNRWIYSILFYTIVILFLGIIFKLFLNT